MTPRTFAAWWKENSYRFADAQRPFVLAVWNAALDAAEQATRDALVEELPGADTTLERVLGAIRALRTEARG